MHMSLRARPRAAREVAMPARTDSGTLKRPITAARRPSLSPALYSLASVWAAARVCAETVVGAHLGEGDPARTSATALVVCVCAGMLLGLACVVVRRARPVLAVLALSVPLGALCSALAVSHTLGCRQALLSQPASSVELVVASDPRPTASGSWSFHASVRDKGSSARLGEVLVTASENQIRDAGARLGSVLSVVGRWSDFSADEFGTQEMCRGVAARLKAARIHPAGWEPGPIGALRALRAKAVDVLSRGEAGPGSRLVAGVVLGHTAGLVQGDVSDDFRALGLSHLVAVSGTHMAVVAGVLGVLLRAARVRPGPRAAATVACLVCYVVLSGVQPSAVRSFAMVCLALTSGAAFRRAHAVSALSLASTAMVLVQPGLVFQLGFVLSVLSVLGITCFARLAGDWAAALFAGRAPRALTDVAAVTLVAQAFTLPVTLPTFSVLPVASPLANLAVGPLMTVLLVYGLAAVGLCCVFPAVSAVVLMPAEVVGGAVARISSGLASLPYAAVPASPPALPCAVALVVLCSLVYYFWPAPSARASRLAGACAMALCAVAFVRLRFLAPDQVVVLDVGQGDAILVQSGAGSILVDTGPGDAVVAALGRHGVIHLDAVLLTHTDSDHVGGLESLVRLVDVDTVVLAQGVPDALQAGRDPELLETIEKIADKGVIAVAAGDRLAYGSARLEVLWPASPVAGDENEDSVVARLSFAGDRSLSCLLCGDAEQGVLEPLAQAGAVDACDVLKVGHHGSAVSVGPALLCACDPMVAVASAGEGNRYGHPTEQCRAELRAHGVPFLCTIWSGDVTFTPGEGHPQVSVGRGSPSTGVASAR